MTFISWIHESRNKQIYQRGFALKMDRKRSWWDCKRKLCKRFAKSPEVGNRTEYNTYLAENGRITGSLIITLL